MQAFQRDLFRFEGLNAQVLGVSPDSPATHDEFRVKYGISFPLISDEKGALQRQYAPGRVSFIIDRAGVVRFIQKGVPDNALLLRELEKLQS